MEWYKDMGPSVDKIERQSRNLQCTACHKQASCLLYFLILSVYVILQCNFCHNIVNQKYNSNINYR